MKDSNIENCKVVIQINEQIDFDKEGIENLFREANDKLLKSEITTINYKDADTEIDFNKNNKDLLDKVNKKSIVYYRWRNFWLW